MCCYSELSNGGTFIFGLNVNNMRTEVLKTHVKPDNSKETVDDVVTETKAIDSAKQSNKLIAGLSKGINNKRSNMIYPQFRIVAT